MKTIKIAYLHGLKANNNNAKTDWLKTIANLYAPQIDYWQPNIYEQIKAEVLAFEPDWIIGSSMGGYFAYEIAKELNIKAVLFNPALQARSLEPDMYGHEAGAYRPKILAVFGEKDEVIDPLASQAILQEEGYRAFTWLGHGHKTPLEVFVKAVTEAIEGGT